MIPMVSFALAVLILGVKRNDKPRKRVLMGFRGAAILLLLLVISIVVAGNLNNLKNFVQWWFSSEQVLMRRLLSHEAVVFNLTKALVVNIVNPIFLYLSFSIIPESWMKGIRNWLQSKFTWASRYLQKINGKVGKIDNNFISFLTSSEKRKKIIFRLVSSYKSYKHEYIALFFLSLIPYIGAAVVFTGKALEIRFELVPILSGKIAKVLGLATIAYFAYFI